MLTSQRALEGALIAFVLGSIFACGSEASSPNDNGGTANAGSGGSSAGSGGTAGTGGAAGSGGNVAGTGGTAGSGGGAGTGGTAGTGGSDGGTAATGGSGGSSAFDAGSDPNRNKVQAGQVCDRLATIQCAGEAACCDSPGRTYDQCKTAQLEACASLYLDEVTANPVSGFDATAAETAFNEFENLASMCDTSIAQWGISTDGLRSITKGTVAPAGDCSPDNALDTAQDAAALASCTNADTTACLPPATGPLGTWTCTARAAANGRCFTDLNCQDGLYCDNPNLTNFSAQCKQRKADGQPCGQGNECTSLVCKGGVCVPADQQPVYCLAP